ncbi:MAG: hypothetical protein O7B27_11980 [Gammaproteobacteria bacterium]|nr:hypothetical protein [Gammaproteobacteria bacterium]
MERSSKTALKGIKTVSPVARQRELRMEAAYRIGVAAAHSDEGDAFNHPDTQGPCRIQWTQAYKRGHFAGKTSTQ